MTVTVSLSSLFNYMDAKNISHFSVSFAARYGLYFGQGNVSRSGMCKLTGRDPKGNACTHLNPADLE